MVVKTLNNILPKNINKAIITYLVNECSWCVARDANKSCHDTLINLKSYLGFTIDTMDVKHHEYLNIYANIIIEKVKEVFNINKKHSRLMWNMYYIGHNGLPHIDDQDPSSISIIYNLNTTDGGTKINKKFYPDLEGQAKIFSSNVKHVGFGPKKDIARFNLNVVLKT
tara:strand:- start:849 stop:1352 length:504 start_codon:yes stop_codon:yes gene_type:complete